MSEMQQLSLNSPMEKALNNILILDLIGWYATNRRTLHEIRLINRNFNQIAVAKANRFLKIFVVIDNRLALDSFVMLMDKRFQEQIAFSCYKINLLGLAAYRIKKFGTSIGEFVSVLDITGPVDGSRSQGGIQNKEQVLTMLQYIPNIISLKIWTLEEIFLWPTEIGILPLQFQHLAHLQVLYGYEYTNNNQWNFVQSPNIRRLGTVIVSKSPRLTQIKIPMIKPSRGRVRQNLPLYPVSPNDTSLKAPHMLALTDMLELPNWEIIPRGQTRSKAFWLDNVILINELLPIYREISNLRIRLSKINVRIQYFWNSNISIFLNGFLGEQSENLEELCIEMGSFSRTDIVPNPPFTIPHLPNLKSLNLDFGNSYESETFGLSSQFPELQILVIKGYSDKFNTFNSFVFPKLTTLKFYHPIGPFMRAWASMVPSLKCLKLSLTTTEHLTHIESKIYYAIKHFINLTSLELNFDKEADESKIPNIWNVLTGFLPRVTQEILDDLDENLNLTADEPCSSRGEAFSTDTNYSTLGNLKELQELHLTGLGKHNIFAIVYMTKQGLLRPIPAIIIKEYFSEIPEKHLTILRQVHSEVYFSKCVGKSPNFTAMWPA